MNSLLTGIARLILLAICLVIYHVAKDEAQHDARSIAKQHAICEALRTAYPEEHRTCPPN